MKMDKYKNKYRIPSARARFWDYRWNAAYFVTICTQNREHWFGKIVKTQNAASPNKMDLSPIGHIANSCWYEIPHHFPFVELGAHVIMPNHVHGIVIINKPDDERDDGRNDVRDDGRDGGRDDGRDDGRDVETQNFASLQQQHPDGITPPDASQPRDASQPPEPNKPQNQFGPQSKNLASIIRGFKIGVTKNARQIHSDFAWQSRYHDHIIRDDPSFQRISNYIIHNPAHWQEDKFNT